MITNLKKWSFLSLIGVGVGLLLFMVPKAIKFFFRGILLLMENPLEGLSFIVICGVFLSIGIYIEQKEKETAK